jgi:hypothetical protein
VESKLHLELKRCAAAWLRSADASGVAHEVRTAIPFWRADVGGWLEHPGQRLERTESLARASIERMLDLPPGGQEALFRPSSSDAIGELFRRAGATDLFGQPETEPAPATIRTVMSRVETVLIECKASRADFLSDRADLDQAHALHKRMQRRRERIRAELLPRWEPHLRRLGETLFAETDGWNADQSRLQSIRQADRDARLAQAALASQVKFAKMAQWRLADRLYLCTPAGLVREAELPDRWGWLEVTRGALRLRRAATPLLSPTARRWRTLRNIQRATARP